MEQAFGLSNVGGYESLSRCSWTAFVRPTLVIGFVALVLGSILWNLGAIKLFVIFVVGMLALYALTVLSLLSRELYVDDGGVWLSRGIFPWNKGVVGLKWRDLDEALFSQGLFGWLSGSHTVLVQHRYTQSNQLVLPSMHRGDRAAIRINELHRGLIQQLGVNDVRLG